MNAAPKPYRPAASGPSRLSPARSCSGAAVQGMFLARPIVPAAQQTLRAAQAKLQNGAVLQRQRTASRPGVEAFEVSLQPKSGGFTLPRDVQAKMEGALGASFADVRIHVGSEASSIGALAFTWGTDIHFAPGQYNPHTQQGQFLLGHELQHVVQQRAGRVGNPFGSGVAVVQDQMLESEADRMGHSAANWRPPV